MGVEWTYYQRRPWIWGTHSLVGPSCIGSLAALGSSVPSITGEVQGIADLHW